MDTWREVYFEVAASTAQARGSRTRISHRTRNAAWSAFFLFPTVALLVVFRLIPMFASFGMAVTNFDGMTFTKFVGLTNFQAMLQLDLFWISLENVALFTGEMVIVCLVLGLLIALMLERDFPGRNIIRTIHMSPMVISVAVLAWTFKMLFSQQWGPVPQLMRTLGLPSIDLLNDPHWAMTGVALMTIWREVGYFFIILLAGLQAIDKELYEAADIDGASFLRRVWHITIPLLRPVFLFLTITGVLNGVQLFGQVLVVSADPNTPIPPGGPLNSTQTPVLLIYDYAFRYGKPALASAIAVALFAIMLAVTAVQARLGRLDSGVS